MLYLGADHAGYELKEKFKRFLEKEGFQYIDMTPTFVEGDDYPDVAKKIGTMIAREHGEGVLICGSGAGICMAANKIKGIRAALCYNKETARLAKEHNNANVICFGGRTMTLKDISENFKEWASRSFSSEERHHRRIRKIDALE